MNLCSKPGCAGIGAAVLAYEYKAGSARLDDLPEVPISPHLYILCDRCAESLRPPRGWILDDRRTKAMTVAEMPPADAAPAPAVALDARARPALEPDELEPDERNRQLAFGYSA